MTRNQINWEQVERDYRAGIKTLRQIGEECGVSHVSIQKRAQREGWPRDLSAKIHSKAEQLVTKDVATSLVTKETLVTEKEIVEANAQAIAVVDLTNRKDVSAAIAISRSQLEELAAMGDPRFIPVLEWIGEQMDQSTEEDGRKVVDKVNETYRYIISLAGRVKMAKDIASSIGTYIPMQRKMLKLDAEAKDDMAAVDRLLKQINGSK